MEFLIKQNNHFNTILHEVYESFLQASKAKVAKPTPAIEEPIIAVPDLLIESIVPPSNALSVLAEQVASMKDKREKKSVPLKVVAKEKEVVILASQIPFPSMVKRSFPKLVQVPVVVPVVAIVELDINVDVEPVEDIVEVIVEDLVEDVVEDLVLVDDIVEDVVEDVAADVVEDLVEDLVEDTIEELVEDSVEDVVVEKVVLEKEVVLKDPIVEIIDEESSDIEMPDSDALRSQPIEEALIEEVVLEEVVLEGKVVVEATEEPSNVYKGSETSFIPKDVPKQTQARKPVILALKAAELAARKEKEKEEKRVKEKEARKAAGEKKKEESKKRVLEVALESKKKAIKTAQPKPLAKAKPQTIAILDSSSSSDEEIVTIQKKKPLIPNWAQTPRLKEVLAIQQRVNPDKIFDNLQTPNLREILGSKLMSTGPAERMDRITTKEKEDYIEAMGFDQFIKD